MGYPPGVATLVPYARDLRPSSAAGVRRPDLRVARPGVLPGQLADGGYLSCGQPRPDTLRADPDALRDKADIAETAGGLLALL